MASDRLNIVRTVAITLILSLGLGACGRKGALDPPPSSEMPSPAVPNPPAAPSRFIDPMTPTGGAQQGPVQATQAAAPVVQNRKKTFVLDSLIQ